MKKFILLSLVLALMTGSCTREKKSPIEGAWKLVYSKNAYGITFPIDIQGGQIKTWSNGYYTFVGQYIQDSVPRDKFGAGTYKIDGNRCETTRLYHNIKSNVGKTSRMLIEIRNDTLFQKDPADENWELPQNFGTEIYVRLK